MKGPAALRRRDLAAIVRWSGALVVLGLLMVALLSLPYQMYAVRTGSMEPSFGPRDLILVHEGEWQQGQPITFAHNAEVITHRFVSVNGDGTFLTKGDANETPDPWVVRPGDVLGGVVTSVPHLGYWLVYFTTIPGLGSVVFLAVGTRLLWSIADELGDDGTDGADGAGEGTAEQTAEQAKSGALSAI